MAHDESRPPQEISERRTRLGFTMSEFARLISALIAATVVVCGFLYSIKSGQADQKAAFEIFAQKVSFQFQQITESQSSFVKDRDAQRLDWTAWRIKKDERDTQQDTRIQRIEDRLPRS